MTFQESVPLSPLTTLGVGGRARFFAEARSADDVAEALEFARARALAVFVLGGGSNTLVADSGFDGLVIAMKSSGAIYEERGDRVLVTAEAGVAWDDLVAETVSRGYSGLECLSGIPGTVGGAVVGNIGAYGAQCSDTFVRADAIDSARGGALRAFAKDECGFSYHDSMFGHAGGRFVLVRAMFELPKKGTSRPAYKDSRFDLEASTRAGAGAGAPTPARVRAEILRVRAEKGVLACSFKSAGSFFHMPFVSPEAYEHTAAVARALDAEKEESLRPWAWKQEDGAYKLAPGFLLEYTEFQKGYARGPVGISPKHTLSIINIADARASDVARLARDMRDAVKRVFGVVLEREVEYVGEVEVRNA